VFIVATVFLIVASAALGWLLMVYKVMPGTTAVWGMAPGAASAMVVMAESYGADVRLVAFMQYTRVVLVTAVAALVARAAGGHLAVDASQVAWFAVPYPSHLAATVVLVLAGTWAAQRFALPGGAMVIPLVLGSVLQVMGLNLVLPPALLALAYAAIGWSVGLRFTPAILHHALRALPKVLGAILALMGVGLLIAVGLMVFTGLDPLSAYLATSPGGADSMAVIAATSAVETSFVMAMQLARFLMVLLAGPAVSKWVAGRGKSVS
jgi:membrane AbrB-like protein